jgi:hypothetical protein
MDSELSPELAYIQLRQNPSLVFVPGKYLEKSGIFAWETYTGIRHLNRNNGQPILTLCFVSAEVDGIAHNFHDYYVPATLNRVALVTFEPTRNITGGYADESQTLDNKFRKEQIEDWIKDLIQ